MSNLPSLQSIDFGSECFYYAQSFSLMGTIKDYEWQLDLPRLQSVKLGDKAFAYQATTFQMTSLISLESIEIGNECFGGHYHEYWYWYVGHANSFSLIGEYD